MIISCPECETRYDLPDAALGPTGKQVQCARCQTRWMASVSPSTSDPPIVDIDDIDFADGPADSSLDDDAFTDGELRPVGIVDGGNDLGFVDTDHLGGFDDVAHFGDQTDSAKPTVFASRRVVVKRKKSRGSAPIHAFLVGAAIAFAAIGVWLREPVVRFAPHSAVLYDLIGLPVNLVGLEFADVTWRKIRDSGTPVLEISGRIINVGTEGVAVPKIRLSLVNGDNQELYSWLGEPPVPALMPGLSTQFHTRLASPPRDADNLMVRFAVRETMQVGRVQ